MFTILSGTSRLGSNTLKVAKNYQRIIESKGFHANLFSLEGIDWAHVNANVTAFEEKYLSNNQHLIILVPEYNGSYPGALKMFIDHSNIKSWWNRKAMLVGISTGRAGNLRGMDHLTGVLNYIKITIFHNKLPISVVDTLMNSEGIVTDPNTLKDIEAQIDGFIEWLNK